MNAKKTVVEGLAHWFGLGKLPKSPGTFGTVGAIPLVYVFLYFGPVGYMVATLLFMALAVVVSQLFENMHGGHDASEIVIDEVAGFLVTMTWIPFTWTGVLLGFALFRLFDIWKPGPIRRLDQKVKGGFGVVIDDVAAGLLANVILQFWFGRFALGMH